MVHYTHTHTNMSQECKENYLAFQNFFLLLVVTIGIIKMIKLKAHLKIQSPETNQCNNLSHPGITFGYLLSPRMQNRVFPENDNSSDSSGIRKKGLKQVYGNVKEMFGVSTCISGSSFWV